MPSVSIRCPLCGTVQELEIPEEGLARYLSGAYLQDAFPDLSPGEREALITGLCDTCWEEMTQGPDDEEVEFLESDFPL